MEMEHIDRFRTLMNNRMYCDYYKLFHIILSYIKENRAELDITELEIKTYPVYKDLEPFSEYKIEDIKEIHSNILMILNKLYGITVEKTDNIEHYNEKHHVGFSISNFLNTLSYENRLLQEQIHLYVNYISFFHISQKRQLNRLHLRMQEFYREVDNNINVNKTFSIEDVGDEDRLHRFFILGEDVSIEDILEDSELLLENSEKILNRIETLSPEPEINADEENDKEEAHESEPAITAILDTNEES